MKNRHFILSVLLVFLIPVPGCTAQNNVHPAPPESEERMREMDAKQKEANRQASQELISRMSLRTMFPDERVRALANAAGRGRIEQIEQLVAQGIDVNARGTSGATPLYLPIRQGNVTGFKKLLELGADPNVIYEDGTSVMYFVASEDNLEFLQLALKHGADPNLVSGRRSLALEKQGVYMGFVGQTPIVHAILYNRNPIQAIDLLLKAGADINARESLMHGGTPLISSTSGKRYDVTLALLERGADYTIKAEGNGRTWGLLDRISRDRRLLMPDSEQMQQLVKVIEWLAERGVDIPEEE